MKVLVSILLSLALSVCANPPLRQAREIAQRRQSLIGYSNNIFHENPAYPDQAAQSSVNVNFSPVSNQLDTKKYYNPYVQNSVQKEYTPNYQTAEPQSQLFNVGYSVSFTNAQQAKPLPSPSPTKYARTRPLDDGEIITGTRKQNEQVQVPNINNMSPEDFVSTALLDNKKHKISGIKPKPQFVQSYPNPKALLTQANLSPTTQKYYKTLEQAKPQVPNVQDIQQRYSWRNIGPGVEIIRSTEVPTISQKYSSRSEQPQFDHTKALGRSQEFDYTNAVENRNGQVNIYQHLPPITRVLPTQKVPIDMSLLREPVPIQVDTRYLEEAMRKQLGAYKSVGQYAQQEPGQSQESYLYRTIAAPQYQDYQADQSRYQYKIYGKPQPVSHEQIRQPRYLADLHTNLRPPPFSTVTYQRRIHVG